MTDTTGPDDSPAPSSVNQRFTTSRGKRPKQYRETMDYLQAARRFMAGAGRRVAEGGDEIELGELIRLVEQDGPTIVQAAVDGMRARGCSWTYIAAATGVSKENAWKRWGKNR